MKIYYSKMEDSNNISPIEGVVLYAKSENNVIKQESKELIKTITERGYKGITFAGAWEQQLSQLLEMLKLARIHGLRVAFISEHDFEPFRLMIGITASEKINKKKFDEKYIRDNMGELSLIGTTLLDYLIEDDYFFICTSNDKIYRINKVGDDNVSTIS